MHSKPASTGPSRMVPRHHVGPHSAKTRTYYSQTEHLTVGQVLDIGGSSVSKTFKAMLETRLVHDDKHHRLLPSPLLSDDVGLKLWSQITHLPDYYQTRDEIELLRQSSREIANHVVPGCTLVDLGSGDIRKIKPLLDYLEVAKKETHYFALDLSKDILKEAMAYLTTQYKFVHCFGLWGTFEDGLKWAKNVSGPRFFFSLGSIFGNDFFDSAVERLRPWAQEMRPDDRMLLGMDATADADEIWNSYHDAKGLFERFMRNGLVHSNRVLEQCWYKTEDWTVRGVLDKEPVMHRFVFRALNDVVCVPLGLHFASGDEIDCYEAFKYGPKIMRKQFDQAGLNEICVWKAPSSKICESISLVVHGS